MALGPIDESQRKAARIAGWAYLVTLAIVVYVNFGIHDRLMVSGDAAETARNILAHERLFRLGILGDLLYCAGVVVLLTALYVILRPVNWGAAFLAAVWRFLWVLMWLVMTLRLLDALRLLRGADSLGAFEAERVRGLAALTLGARFDYYYVGLLFGALASTICSYLWLRSRYIPRALAAFGLICSAWCVACTLTFYVFPHFDGVVNLWWFDTPMGIFDIALSFWLLLKGLTACGIAEGDKRRDRAPVGAT
jgi:Domain of unknown function (DUF4386)